MINFNPLLTQEEAKWVLDQWFILDHRVCHSTLSKMMELHNKVFKESVSVDGCSCAYKAQHAMWSSRLNQYKAQIESVAYPLVQVTPSEIIKEAITEIQTLPNEIRVKTVKNEINNIANPEPVQEINAPIKNRKKKKTTE
jgi:alkyl hydroperoxide reductase subunit AhpC